MYEFDWSSIVPSLPYLLDGLVITLKITVTAVVIGILWGTMLAVMRLSSFAPVAWFAKAYVNVFRSIPLVMVLLWFYLIVPGFLQNVLGLSPKNDIRLISAMVAFSMFEAAYYSEIIRAGIQSISRGQSSAALALGMTHWQSMKLIILPQACSARWCRFCSLRASYCSRIPHWCMCYLWPISSVPPQPLVSVMVRRLR